MISSVVLTAFLVKARDALRAGKEV